MLQNILLQYRSFLRDTPAVISTVLSICFLFVSLLVNYFASQYAFIKKDNPVADLLLDNLPVVNIDTPFVVGTWLFVIFLVFFLLARPRRIAFILKAMALFIIIRSMFVIMTHLGPSPMTTLSAPGDIGKAFTSGADLFFSGHTGMPFLFALMYWHNKRLRIAFIVISIFAAAGVLLGHVHYSIDVASAYFITHGIYLVATRLFRRDFDRFHNKI